MPTMTRRHPPPELRNPFRAPRGNVVSHSQHARSARQVLQQACWILLVGTVLVLALSWAVPQPPASQPMNAQAMGLLKAPKQKQQQSAPRKGGGVRGQSKLPPKKTNDTTTVQNIPTATQQHGHNWDPKTLEHQVEDRHDDDDEAQSGGRPKSSGDTSKHPTTVNDSSTEEEDENAVEHVAVRSGTGPFGRDTNAIIPEEEKRGSSDIGSSHDGKNSNTSGNYDPNDPDEADERPPLKRPPLNINSISIQKKQEESTKNKLMEGANEATPKVNGDKPDEKKTTLTEGKGRASNTQKTKDIDKDTGEVANKNDQEDKQKVKIYKDEATDTTTTKQVATDSETKVGRNQQLVHTGTKQLYTVTTSETPMTNTKRTKGTKAQKALNPVEQVDMILRKREKVA